MKDRTKLIADLDDVFARQTIRVKKRLAKRLHTGRPALWTGNDGPLIMPESGTLAPAGDVIDVRNK